MTWYYTREAGDEGQVLTDEGIPVGARLTDVLDTGPLPMGVAFELIAYLADILTIAEEDRAMHGDISPGDVYINEKGSVSLSNYGPMRTQGRAPEGKPMFPASDVYGLGVVLHAVLSTQSLGAIPRQRDAHDDAIVDHLLAIDWTALEGLPGRDSLIHFLCSMLAHDPSERPAPLDVANVLAEAGQKIGGDGVLAWSEKRWGNGGSIQEELPTISEVLEEPEALGRVFNKTGQFSRRQTASAKGECTAFWSRDKISAMLDEGEDPLAGSQMFQRRELQDKLRRDDVSVYRTPPATSPPAPSPSPPPPTPPVASPPRPPSADAAEKPWVPDATISGHPTEPGMVEALAELRQRVESKGKPTPPAAQDLGPSVSSAPPSTSVAREGRSSVVSPVTERRAPQKPFPWLIVVIGAVGSGLVIGMLALAAAIYYSVNEDKSGDQQPATVEVEAEEPKPKPKPKAKPKPTTKRPKSSTPKATSARKSKPASKPAPAPVPTTDFDVSFRSMGSEAQLVCGDGQSGRFVGTTRRKFSDVTTCRITIDGKNGAVQVKRKSTVSCRVVGAAVVCSGA